MSYINKRSRTAYEADLEGDATSHVTFGTPLPPLDPDVRDDGSYVPLHKQEVRDEHGRRRLHGAFTGGWSAGYFNTVGSKEGWTPSTFVSSRENRRKDDPKAIQQRPEDYMDHEDLAEAAAAQVIQTTDPFAALGGSGRGHSYGNSLAGLLRIQGDNMGLKLLRKMGWKDGQGIGPKMRREARLGVSTLQPVVGETHLFAPDDINMIAFARKADRKGMGYERAALVSGLIGSENESHGHRYSERDADGGDDYNDDASIGPRLLPGMTILTKKGKNGRQSGFGVGILNDTGSDDDDPYDMGPRISYNRVLGGDKTKKKKKKASNASTVANPALGSRPVFIPKPNAKGHGGARCQIDGKPPPKGFVLARAKDSRLSGELVGVYPSPAIPEGWIPAKCCQSATKTQPPYTSTADAAKAARHDPRSRAAILGEAALPGKSVFDFMSEASRDRLAAASGKANLPKGKGEIPAEYNRPSEQQERDRSREPPRLAKETAIAAISRGAGAGGPYANDDGKQARYRLYLQTAAGIDGDSFPPTPVDMTHDELLRELQEFYDCAQRFRPMTGFMATRFTTASAGSQGTFSGSETAPVLDAKAPRASAPLKPLDSAEEAARMGMYGRLTRLTDDFYPTRLLCKRFNVHPPQHVQPESDTGAASVTKSSSLTSPTTENALNTGLGLEQRLAKTNPAVNSKSASELLESQHVHFNPPDVDRAVEITRPGDDVFREIFGDSSDEDE